MVNYLLRWLANFTEHLMMKNNEVNIKWNIIIIFADDSTEPLMNSSSDVVDSSDFDNVVDDSDPDPKSNTLCFYNTEINKFSYDFDVIYLKIAKAY